jgi:hypothetical protein
MATVFDNLWIAKSAVSTVLPRRWRWFKWRDVEHAIVRDFFSLTELTDEQRLSLRRRQLDYLGWGALYWLISLIIGACVLAYLGEKQSVQKFLIWCLALDYPCSPASCCGVGSSFRAPLQRERSDGAIRFGAYCSL